METRPVDPLFKIAYMTDVPPFKPEIYESDADPLRRWVSIGMDGETQPNDKPWVDPSWQGGFFIDSGVNIAFKHFLWMLRQVNVNHPLALQWLENNGWDLPVNHCAWYHHVVFDTGTYIGTSSKYRFEEAWRPKIDGHEFVILEGAVIAVERVVNVHSVWGQTNSFAETFKKSSEGSTR